MFARRIITAERFPAGLTYAQVYPARTVANAFRAYTTITCFNLINCEQMRADVVVFHDLCSFSFTVTKIILNTYFQYLYDMKNTGSLLRIHKQNHKLPIRIISPEFGHLPAEIAGTYSLTQRKAFYFFLFMIDGQTQHNVDLLNIDLGNNELLFILPHQMHTLPDTKHGNDYFKLGFDEDCLSLLPKQFPFLINPYNSPKIAIPTSVGARLKSTFQILVELLSVMDTDPELILAHLNSLLTEINNVYFSGNKNPATDKLSKFIGFKHYIENHLSDHPTIIDIAGQLALNPNSLYHIVKHYSGISPKEFITNRLILEAKRRLYYVESSSIKELAFELGFNDPDYFSRTFRKVTGKTIAAFIQDLSGY
jgi:AraC-like DNA-binding protein